ncbi:MAG TPA: hypothetical protein VKU83_05740, partial [Puia sp.]|nr:hypothetical protein [Puia sp.]
MRAAILYILLLLPAIRPDAQETRKEGLRPLAFARELAATAMRIWPDSGNLPPGASPSGKWELMLATMRLWYSTGDARYYTYARRQADRWLAREDGGREDPAREDPATFPTGGPGTVDDCAGRLLLRLFEVTEKPDYYRAAARLRQWFRRPPGTPRHVLVPVVIGNPCCIAPFRAHYAALFHEDSVFDEIGREFVDIERYLYVGQTGALKKGTGATCWGMGLVDALQYFPAANPG